MPPAGAALWRLSLVTADPEDYSTRGLAVNDGTEEFVAEEDGAFGLTHFETGPVGDVVVAARVEFACRISGDSLSQTHEMPETTFATYRELLRSPSAWHLKEKWPELCPGQAKACPTENAICVPTWGML
jgi:hypothetical protein